MEGRDGEGTKKNRDLTHLNITRKKSTSLRRETCVFEQKKKRGSKRLEKEKSDNERENVCDEDERGGRAVREAESKRRNKTGKNGREN
jgi:hypothetical protein